MSDGEADRTAGEPADVMTEEAHRRMHAVHAADAAVESNAYPRIVANLQAALKEAERERDRAQHEARALWDSLSALLYEIRDVVERTRGDR